MKYNLEFHDLRVVLFDKFDKDFPVNKDDFIPWIKKNRGKNLGMVKEFTDWSYLINGKVHNFFIDRGEGDTWHVHKSEKKAELYFPFNCSKGNNLITVFEEGLLIKLNEENFNPYFLNSPDYPVQIDL